MIGRHESPTFHKRVPLRPRRRANLCVSSEQLATLLNLPPDVTVAAFALDFLRDAVVFSLASDRFDVVPEGCDARELVANLDVSTGDDGTATRRVTWDGLEGAEVVTRHGGDTYRLRTATVRARQWTGDEAFIRELCPAFRAIDEEDRVNSDDPEATAEGPFGPFGNRGLVYTGDWIIQRIDGFACRSDTEFAIEYEPMTP